MGTLQCLIIFYESLKMQNFIEVVEFKNVLKLQFHTRFLMCENMFLKILTCPAPENKKRSHGYIKINQNQQTVKETKKMFAATKPGFHRILWFHGVTFCLSAC